MFNKLLDRGRREVSMFLEQPGRSKRSDWQCVLGEGQCGQIRELLLCRWLHELQRDGPKEHVHSGGRERQHDERSSLLVRAQRRDKAMKSIELWQEKHNGLHNKLHCETKHHDVHKARQSMGGLIPGRQRPKQLIIQQ